MRKEIVMDKDKLIEDLKQNAENFRDSAGFDTETSVFIVILMMEIINGKFDKRKCSNCERQERYNSELIKKQEKDKYVRNMPLKYCSDCGRKLQKNGALK